MHTWLVHLFKILKKMKMRQSKNDACLWFGKDLIVIIYCDDCGICSKSPEIANKFVEQLQAHGLRLTVEGPFSKYLGIQIKMDEKTKTVKMSQPGLIKKLLELTDMVDCAEQYVPARREAVGSDPDGEPWTETWTLPQANGTLLYLATNTRPDIAFAVSQTARYNHCPRKSHATAVKKIVRYLKGTMHEGITYKLPSCFDIEAYADSDYAGLYRQEPDEDPTSVKSRMGYVIFWAGFPLLCKSKLISVICLSTSEAEYASLSSMLRELIPVRLVIKEVMAELDIGDHTSLTTTIHQDNDATRLLATRQHITNRTKHFLVRWHHFWGFLNENQDTVYVIRCDTKQMIADYLTKGLPKEAFEYLRRKAQGW